MDVRAMRRLSVVILVCVTALSALAQTYTFDGAAKLAVFFFGFGAFVLERRDLIRRLRGQGLA